MTYLMRSTTNVSHDLSSETSELCLGVIMASSLLFVVLGFDHLGRLDSMGRDIMGTSRLLGSL